MRKVFSMFTVPLAILIILSFSLMSVSGSTEKHFSFEKWTGNGSVSVTVDIDKSAFADLKISSEIDKSNYSVSGNENSTVITLKEGFLKTLDFYDEEYNFTAHFNKEGINITSFDAQINEQNDIAIPSTLPTGSRVNKITLNNAVVDNSYYTVLTDSNKIHFNAEYAALFSGQPTFKVYMVSDDIYVTLSLTKDIPETTTEEQDSTAQSTTEENTTTNTGTGTTASKPPLDTEIPRTGDESSLPTLGIIAFIAVIGLVVAMRFGKKKKGE